MYVGTRTERQMSCEPYRACRRTRYGHSLRNYSPTLGRFLQTDPLGYDGDGSNLYAYVLNDPVNGTDPLGLQVAPPPGPEIIVTRFKPIEPTGLDSANRLQFVRDFSQLIEKAETSLEQAIHDAQSTCKTPPLTKAERDAAQSGNRAAFWASRFARGDPLGAVGLTMVTGSGFAAQWANTRLRDAITSRSPQMSSSAVTAEVQQIGVQLMRAHAVAIWTYGNPTAGQIATYHFDIFAAHGLPRNTFGGAPVTGTSAEASLTSGVWMQCR